MTEKSNRIHSAALGNSLPRAFYETGMVGCGLAHEQKALCMSIKAGQMYSLRPTAFPVPPCRIFLRIVKAACG